MPLAMGTRLEPRSPSKTKLARCARRKVSSRAVRQVTCTQPQPHDALPCDVISSRMSQARAVPVALAASGSPRAGLRFASVISRRSDACSRARMTPVLVRTRLFQFTRPGNATRLARDCPAKKSQPLRGNFGRTTRRFATRIWNPGNVVSTASFPHHSTSLAAIRFGARKEGQHLRGTLSLRFAGSENWPTSLRRPIQSDTLPSGCVRCCRSRPFTLASQPSHSALTAKSQNILASRCRDSPT